jgi:hypothetical protein
MTAVATAETRPPGRELDGEGTPTPQLFDPARPTLEDRIVATWDELTAAGRTACPVCSGEMTSTRGCASCGSELG